MKPRRHDRRLPSADSASSHIVERKINDSYSEFSFREYACSKMRLDGIAVETKVPSRKDNDNHTPDGDVAVNHPTHDSASGSQQAQHPFLDSSRISDATKVAWSILSLLQSISLPDNPGSPMLEAVPDAKTRLSSNMHVPLGLEKIEDILAYFRPAPAPTLSLPMNPQLTPSADGPETKDEASQSKIHRGRRERQHKLDFFNNCQRRNKRLY